MLFPSCMLSPVLTLRHTNLMLENAPIFKKLCKDFSNYSLIKMLGSNIAMTEEFFQKAKVFF